jgi:hypothetical protein
MKKKVFLGFLMITVLGMSVYGQLVFTGPTEEFRIEIGGELSGMATLGLQADNQIGNNQATNSNAPGVFFPNTQTGSMAAVGTGKNGYFNNFDLTLLISPISYIELYARFKTRYQPGSPYLPFQLDSAANDTYDIKTDAAWARLNAITGLGFDIPLDLWIKAGRFNASASNFNSVSRFGMDSVLSPLQTGTNQSFQIEAVYNVQDLGPIALSFTAPLRLNEQVKQYYDNDSEENILSHFDATGEFAEMLPMHISLKVPEVEMPFGTLHAEVLYAINSLYIRSGHNMGIGIGAKIPLLDGLITIPIGLGVAFTEKNIDPFTSSSIEISNYEPFYAINGYSKADSYTLGLRQTLRIGFGVGAMFEIEELVKAEFNVGASYSQIAHIYRETLDILSLAVDLRAVFLDKFILGGGIVFGSLNAAEWKVKEGINDVRRPGETADREPFEGHTFGLIDNMGFEVYAGIQLQHGRFVLGYNMNRGISMSRYLEAIPEAQLKYRQAGTDYSDGKFERGGIFAKLVINL